MQPMPAPPRPAPHARARTRAALSGHTRAGRTHPRPADRRRRCLPAAPPAQRRRAATGAAAPQPAPTMSTAAGGTNWMRYRPRVPQQPLPHERRHARRDRRWTALHIATRPTRHALGRRGRPRAAATVPCCAHATANSEPREPRVTFVTEAHRFKPGGFESRHTLSIKFSRGDNIFSETLVVYDYDCSSPVIHLKHLIMNELQLHQVVTLSDDVR